jgi:endogenous inhibitor of DNA gyrase (YacG/DUF329 family)
MSDNIFISCPTTSQPVKTGFRAPKGTDISALKQVTLRNCPACGNRHIWSADAVFWDNEPPAPPSIWKDVRRIWRARKPPEL